MNKLVTLGICTGLLCSFAVSSSVVCDDANASTAKNDAKAYFNFVKNNPNNKTNIYKLSKPVKVGTKRFYSVKYSKYRIKIHTPARYWGNISGSTTPRYTVKPYSWDGSHVIAQVSINGKIARKRFGYSLVPARRKALIVLKVPIALFDNKKNVILDRGYTYSYYYCTATSNAAYYFTR